MHKKILSVLIAFVLVIVLVMFYTYQHSGNEKKKHSKPRILFDDLVVNCPDAVQGQNIFSGNIIIENPSVKDLIITNVKSGCGCAPSRVKTPLTVKPDQRTEFNFKINTKGTKGNYKFPVMITSNAVNAPQQVVYLKGKISPALKFKPEKMILGDLNKKILASEIIIEIGLHEIYHSDGVLSIGHIPAGLSVSLQKNSQHEGMYQCAVNLPEEYPIYAVNEELEFILTTKDTEIKDSILVQCRYFENMLVEPYPINIGTMPASTSKKLHSYIEFYDLVNNVSAVENSGIIKNLNIQKMNDNKYKLTAEIESELPVSLQKTSVKIGYFLSDGTKREIKIPVIGVIY